MLPRRRRALLGGVSRYTPGQVATLARLKAAAASALISNPVDNADMASPPTITQSGSHDATLTVSANPQSNPTSFRSSPGVKHVRTTTNGLYIGTSTLTPNTAGNIGAVTSLSPAAGNYEDENCYTVDFVATAQIVEVSIRVPGGANIPYRIICNNQFVARDGIANTSQFVKMDFGSSATRAITVEVQSGQAFLGVAVSAGGSIAVPSDTTYKGIFYGDSITEGISSGETVFYVFDGWSSVFSKQIGINASQNAGVGSVGYTNTGSTRSKLFGQLPFSVANDTFDLVGVAMGYNDQNQFSNATIVADALACWQNIRTNQPNALILVLGIFGEATGPSAALLATEAALQTQFNAWGDRFSRFIPISTDGSGWLNGTGRVGATNGSGNSDIYVSSDGVHPSRAGRLYLGGKANTAYRALLAAM